MVTFGLETLSAMAKIYSALFYAVVKVFKNIVQPQYILMEFVVEILWQLNIFSDAITFKEPLRLTRTVVGVGILFIFWGTITVNLFNTYEDIIAFGENIMFSLGVLVIVFKSITFATQWKRINAIIETFIELNKKSFDLKNPRIQKIQRFFFVCDAGLFLFFGALGILLCVSISMHPIFTGQSIPLPAWFPFNMQDSEKYPLCSKITYGIQVMALFYGMTVLLPMDAIGLSCIYQTAMNFRIISVRLRELKVYSYDQQMNRNLWPELRHLIQLHQLVLSLANEINDAFYLAYWVQIFSTTFIMGTASFEALLALDDIMVASKFFIFVFIVGPHLAYWCIIGNMAYTDSQEVGVAAFEVREWFTQSPNIKRSLLFMMMRAQKPVEFSAKPFLPYTMETFMKIIRVSYTAFTFLYNSLKTK